MSDTDRGENRLECREGGPRPLRSETDWCPTDKLEPSDFNEDYALPGPQVEPQAAWWLDPREGTPICLPTLQQVIDAVNTRVNQPPSSPQEQGEEAEEPEEPEELEDSWEKELPKATFPFFRSKAELIADFNILFDRFVRQRDQPLPQGALSEFLNLQKQPFGALFNTAYDQFRVDRVLEQDDRLGRPGYEYVRTGAELARLFERETPGLYHHHALHWFLYERTDVSPPRHARIWMALNMTIYAALSAAWYYKWAFNADQPGTPKVSFAIRPYEYARDPRFVLYDFRLNPSGAGSDNPKDKPCPSPGSPRHPAYPSGHSTYSAAASRVLEYFFGGFATLNASNNKVRPEIRELRKLADNIGEARLYAGVHWIRDHRFGQLVGRTVADLVIEQLRKDCIAPVAPPPDPNKPPESPPTPEQVLAMRNRPCRPKLDHDFIPPRPENPGGGALPPEAPTAF